jgi:DNA invertase Pin-like site-specific DNA recombinase
MIGVYLRVSSTSQKGDSQQAAITQWLTSHGHDLAQVRWYTDTETGRTLQRKGFQTLQADIFRGEVKTVVVWKLDRLARSLREGVNVLADWCQRDVRVVSITQQIDLSGAVGQMIASLLFGIAEIEHQHIKERQAAGIAVAKAKGKYKGRQKGTTKAKPERARTLHAKGLTPQEIATALNVSERTVFRYLTGNDP